MLISIVVPIFNAENFLANCINSILNQTYRNFELILIDDGSTDNTAKLCEFYAKLDNRIRVISKNNEGVSATRNLGIELARGEYIGFIDADDTIEPDYLTAFFKEKGCNGKIDLFIQGYVKIYPPNKIKYGFTENNLLCDSDIYHFLCYAESEYLLNCPFSKLFKRHILKSNNLQFQEGISFGEDHLFVLSYLSYVRTVLTSKGCMYNYIHHNANALTKRVKDLSKYEFYIIESDKLKKSLNRKFNYHNDLCFHKIITYGYNSHVAVLINEIFDSRRQIRISERKYLLNKFKSYFRNQSLRGFGLYKSTLYLICTKPLPFKYFFLRMANLFFKSFRSGARF